jgi:hypothetical protein
MSLRGRDVSDLALRMGAHGHPLTNSSATGLLQSDSLEYKELAKAA